MQSYDTSEKKKDSFSSLWKIFAALLLETGQVVTEIQQHLYLFYVFVLGEAKSVLYPHC